METPFGSMTETSDLLQSPHLCLRSQPACAAHSWWPAFRPAPVAWAWNAPRNWRNIPTNNPSRWCSRILLSFVKAHWIPLVHFTESTSGMRQNEDGNGSHRFVREVLRTLREAVTRDFTLALTEMIHVGDLGAKKQDELLGFFQGSAQQVSSDPFADHWGAGPDAVRRSIWRGKPT